MKKNKIIILLLLMLFLVTGCTNNTYLSDKNNKRIVNESTGQNLRSDILCKPETEELIEIYSKYEDSLEFSVEELPKCTEMKLYNSEGYSGLWVQLFVIPLAWYVMKVGNLVNNYGIAIMLVGVMIRVLLIPLTLKTQNQSENMKKAQPELNRIEKKYKEKTDSDSMMQKSQEMMAVYSKYKIKPIGSCLTAFVQLPLFMGFLQAINRVPVIFEERLFTLDLGTTPLFGIRSGNYLYIILIVLIILTTYLSFKLNQNSMGSAEQEKQMQFTTNFMLIFISVASITLPTALALYWISTNAFAAIQSLIFKRGLKQ